jgi:hypothetical protein
LSSHPASRRACPGRHKKTKWVLICFQAAVLALLAAGDGPVALAEVVPGIPAGHDVVAVLAQVQEIDGVSFVPSEPAELSLHSDLRRDLPKRSRGRRTNAREHARPERDAPDKDTPKASLVLLLRESRDLDADLLTHLVNDAFDLELGTQGPDRTEFATGEAPNFFAQFQGRLFMILSTPPGLFRRPGGCGPRVE